MRADLHIHTLFSDGLATPEEVVLEAKRNGAELIAVTDHDTMAASEEVEKFAQKHGVKTVRGIEISAYYGNVKFHTLAYGVDEKKFAPFLKRLYYGSFLRAEDVVKKLNREGFSLNLSEVFAQMPVGGVPVHGAHIARAMVKKGYVKSVGEYFKNFGSFDKPAFSLVCRPTPEETVEKIVSAGGFASVAHPGRIDLDEERLEKKIESLKGLGLGGIEVYYTTHTEYQTAYFKNLADRLGLLPTGGSDTHILTSLRKIGFPPFFASPQLLEKLKVEK